MHKLFLADDSVTIQRVIELTFSGEDIQVVAVNDGEQAISRIPTEQPDIVLADIGMPKRSGYDVAAFVKGHADLAHIPVLLLAGAFERVDEARAEQVKCDGVLVKPFEPRHVVARVRELIAGARQAAKSVPPADIPRPAELARAPVVETPPPVHPAPEADIEPETPAPAAPPAASSFLDASLDDYFEKLNSAFEEVKTPSPSADAAAVSSTPMGREDSLDGYFDRLSAAFADLARPIREREDDTPPPSFDELLSDEPIPTVEALTPKEKQPLPEVRYEPQDEEPEGIADVLSALLADEREFPASESAAPRGTSATGSLDRDALVEEITRRVLERLVPEVTSNLRRLIADELERVVSRQ